MRSNSILSDAYYEILSLLSNYILSDFNLY